MSLGAHRNVYCDEKDPECLLKIFKVKPFSLSCFSMVVGYGYVQHAEAEY